MPEFLSVQWVKSALSGVQFIRPATSVLKDLVPEMRRWIRHFYGHRVEGRCEESEQPGNWPRKGL